MKNEMHLMVKGMFTFLFLFTFCGTAKAQVEIKGIVKGSTYDQLTVLNGANIYLKGTKTGTSTDKKGEFTFPKLLKAGDILEVSYLGFIKKSVTIQPNDSYITIILKEDDNEMLGAPNTNKRYKSKRFKKQ